MLLLASPQQNLISRPGSKLSARNERFENKKRKQAANFTAIWTK